MYVRTDFTRNPSVADFDETFFLNAICHAIFNNQRFKQIINKRHSGVFVLLLLLLFDRSRGFLVRVISGITDRDSVQNLRER